ncbi:F0F1 ATP synthase subunit delta [Enemella evansiae]|uniref:ATP synthase subunit delta n=1 Tax=Enemella evansiae TaxID=2016499 RepID=A0A255GEV1_9ACTN|nr:F0F1 ATP synthase subunit delta [Enemella evansiae]OYO05012.1 F0F1 ATP synthase subunit delta [Enemella evansiae]OYO14378.1 F0F1 ATP synthase subunit delta [Enemella evansiae]
MSAPVSSAEEARLGSLDRVLDAQEPNSTLAGELFAVVDAVEAQPGLRRGLTDPGLSVDQRKGLARQLLTGKVSDQAVRLVEETAALRWGGGRSFAAALERLGVRAELRAAQAAGQLDDTEDELFRFARTVSGDPGLVETLGNRSLPAARRETLVTRLLDGRVNEATLVLARRAVGSRSGNYGNTIEDYLGQAAALRNRGIATVHVAQPLSSEQHERLRAALSRQVGREVDLQVIVDPQVLGGVRVQLGDEVIEGTVAGKLDQARRRLG